MPCYEMHDLRCRLFTFLSICELRFVQDFKAFLTAHAFLVGALVQIDCAPHMHRWESDAQSDQSTVRRNASEMCTKQNAQTFERLSSLIRSISSTNSRSPPEGLYVKDLMRPLRASEGPQAPYKILIGLIRPFKGLIKSLKGLIRLFKGLRRLLRTL